MHKFFCKTLAFLSIYLWPIGEANASGGWDDSLILVFFFPYVLFINAVQIFVSGFIAWRRWKEYQDMQSLLYALIPFETFAIYAILVMLAASVQTLGKGILALLVVAPFLIWFLLHRYLHRRIEPTFIYRR